jgi:outer membrane protein assembly factor BamA
LVNPGEHWGRYGINQELFYAVNNHWTFGLGAEWLKDYRYADQTECFDVYSFRIGTNRKPTSHFTLRPEIRYDKYDSGYRPFNAVKGDPKASQFLYGFSGVLTF